MTAVLDELAEQMLLPACRLVPAVQDGSAGEVHAILSPLSLLDLRALVVVLAALVPADDPAMDVFTTWMHQAKPAPPRPISGREAQLNRARLAEALANPGPPDPTTEETPNA